MLQGNHAFVYTDADTGKSVSVVGYYHDEYYGMYSPNNRVMFVNVLKNDKRQYSPEAVSQSEVRLADAIRSDLALITQMHGSLTLVGVPRSKKEVSYPWGQMGLKRALRRAASENPNLSDGLDYIVRHTDTRCTHRNPWGHGGLGDMPRPGLIAETCRLSSEIAGKDILLVDDIYSAECGVDEDAIGAVLNAGARSVVFYAIGYTVNRNRDFKRIA